MDNGYKFFQNTKCEFFPCHKGEEGTFNCLFCYCPLYALGDVCGGDFVYLENGVKDCSGCLIPHNQNSHEYINSKLQEISRLARQKKQ